MDKPIWILYIESRNSDIVIEAYTSLDKALSALYKWVLEGWVTECIEGPVPQDKTEAIKEYFARMAGKEWCVIRRVYVR